MDMGIPSDVWNCRVDTSGRIVIPHDVREVKHLKTGDQVSICKIGNEFVLRRNDEMLNQLLLAFRANIAEGVNLVDELIAERRAEAVREESGR